MDVSADALTRCQRAFAAFEVIDPPGPATPATADEPAASPGATLPGSTVLQWYREASRTVLGMTEAQLRRDAMVAKRPPGAAGAPDAAHLSDDEMVAALLASMPTDRIASELRARGADVIDVGPPAAMVPAMVPAVRDDNG